MCKQGWWPVEYQTETIGRKQSFDETPITKSQAVSL
jgi:hypothetical protein